MLTSLLQLVTCLLLVGACSCHYGGAGQVPSNAQVGDPCTPSHARTCGNLMLVNQTMTAVSGFGPNVCNATKVYETQTYSYTYQRHCSGWGIYCRLYCKRTNNCDSKLVNVTRTTIECCEGFGVDPTQSSSGGHFGGHLGGHSGGHSGGYSGGHYGGRSRRSHDYSLSRNGCPIMLRDSVLDCLVDLGLTAVFSELGNVPEFLAILGSNTNQSSYTFFAPSDEAFDALSDLNRGSSRMILGGHIVNKTIFSKRLGQGQILTPFDNQYSLHVSTVSSRSTGREIYLNGARINQTDACQARNGIVHVLESVIPLSNQTIAQVLEGSDRFSMFNNLVTASGVVSYLRQSGKSRTVFAPTNEALNKLPSGAIECLLRANNRASLRQFVYIHISYPTEYNSTLSQRSHVRTFTSRPNYWLVITAEGNSIRVTRDMITIQELDIPASNGVIHALPQAIVAIDFTRLCPNVVVSTTPPPIVTTPLINDPGTVLNSEAKDV